LVTDIHQAPTVEETPVGTNDSDTFAGATTDQPVQLISGGQSVAKMLE